MKLYIGPGSCSLSPHIALREAGLKFDIEQVDLRAKKIKSNDGDFTQVNSKGYVPALQLDDGTLLTEGAVIVQYVADQRPRRKLAPRPGTIERYRLQEWLNFIATELHKSFSPLFNAATPDDMKKLYKDKLNTRFDYVEKQLGSKPFLTGDQFSVADGYLFVMLRWSQRMELGIIGRLPGLTSFFERMNKRPAVKAALKAEGLAA